LTTLALLQLLAATLGENNDVGRWQQLAGWRGASAEDLIDGRFNVDSHADNPEMLRPPSAQPWAA